MRRFQRELGITEKTLVLDVGGTASCWSLLEARPRVVYLNMPREPGLAGAGDLLVAGDARRLPFRDGAFDVVFSNSVIEHVGPPDNQAEMAREIARVGASYWVQTPNRRFPVEQHLLTPLLHLLPKKWQRRLARRFTVWALLTRPSRDRWEFYIEHYLNDVRLLDRREFGALFAGAEIWRERFCGLTKSFIAVRRRPVPPRGR